MDGEGCPGGYLSRGRSSLKAMERVSHVMDRYYPERIQKVYIVNVPRIFYMIWSLVKRIIPEKTLAKLELFADSDADRQRFLEAIDAFCPVDRVPKHLGGEGDLFLKG